MYIYIYTYIYIYIYTLSPPDGALRGSPPGRSGAPSGAPRPCEAPPGSRSGHLGSRVKVLRLGQNVATQPAYPCDEWPQRVPGSRDSEYYYTI